MIRLSLDPEMKSKVMQNARLLKNQDETKNIFINNDLTALQSREAYQKRQQTKKDKDEADDESNKDSSDIPHYDATQQATKKGVTFLIEEDSDIHGIAEGVGGGSI